MDRNFVDFKLIIPKSENENEGTKSLAILASKWPSQMGLNNRYINSLDDTSFDYVTDKSAFNIYRLEIDQYNDAMIQ